MTRSHRHWHAWLWALLGPLLVAGFIAGIRARSQPADERDRSREPAKTPALEVKP
jgi:hypothetical protein